MDEEENVSLRPCLRGLVRGQVAGCGWRRAELWAEMDDGQVVARHLGDVSVARGWLRLAAARQAEPRVGPMGRRSCASAS